MANQGTRSSLGRAWATLMRILHRLGDTELSLIAGGVAFFGLLALFPALASFAAVAGLLLDATTVEAQLAPMIDTLPDIAGQLLQAQLTELAQAESGTLNSTLIIGLGLSLFSASRGTLNLMGGLNVARSQPETRGFILKQATGLVLTFGLILGLTISLALVAALPVILSYVASDALASDIVLLIRWPLLLAAAMLGFGLLYRFGAGPTDTAGRLITPGAMVAVILWLVGTIGFAWYVQTFGTYNRTFGTLAGVIVLMLWLYLSSFAVLTGAVVDAELAANRAGADPDPDAAQP